MRYFGMPARGVADDTQNASVNSPTMGRNAKPNTLDEALGREAVSRPGSIALALSGVGGRVVCSDDENAHLDTSEQFLRPFRPRDSIETGTQPIGLTVILPRPSLLNSYLPPPRSRAHALFRDAR